jgi:hypothetical protein
VGAVTLTVSGDTDFARYVKYNAVHAPDAFDDQLGGLRGSTSCRDEIIPDPDSIPLDILHYPTQPRYGIDFSAYDPPELKLPPAEGTHPLLVPPDFTLPSGL